MRQQKEVKRKKQMDTVGLMDDYLELVNKNLHRVESCENDVMRTSMVEMKKKSTENVKKNYTHDVLDDYLAKLSPNIKYGTHYEFEQRRRSHRSIYAPNKCPKACEHPGSWSSLAIGDQNELQWSCCASGVRSSLGCERTTKKSMIWDCGILPR